MTLMNWRRGKNLRKGTFSPGQMIPYGNAGTVVFRAIYATVDIDDPFVVTVHLNDDRVGGDANTGVTIESNINGVYTTNGLFWDGNKIDYDLDVAAVEGEIITITFSGSNITNGDGETLANGVINAANPIDSTVPELLSATIPANGNEVILVFDEPVTTQALGMHIGWNLDVTAGGTPRAIGTVSASGTGTNWSLALDDQVKVDEVLNIDYNDAVGDVRDLQDNYLITIVDRPVVNNSTQGIPINPPELIGQVVENATPGQVDLTFSEAVLGTVAGWDVTINTVSVTGLALVGITDTRQLTFNEAVVYGDVVRVIYVEASGDMQDTAGLPLPDYDELVTNNVEIVAETPPDPDHYWDLSEGTGDVDRVSHNGLVLTGTELYNYSMVPGTDPAMGGYMVGYSHNFAFMSDLTPMDSQFGLSTVSKTFAFWHRTATPAINDLDAPFLSCVLLRLVHSRADGPSNTLTTPVIHITTLRCKTLPVGWSLTIKGWT